MPTYDYQCRSCGHTVEVIHSMLEEGPTTCEICGGQLRRVLFPAGIIFKGSGFYKTDSRAGSSTASSSASTTASSEAGAGGETSGAGDGAAKGDSKAPSDATAKAATKKPDSAGS